MSRNSSYASTEKFAGAACILIFVLNEPRTRDKCLEWQRSQGRSYPKTLNFFEYLEKIKMTLRAFFGRLIQTLVLIGKNVTRINEKRTLMAVSGCWAG